MVRPAEWLGISWLRTGTSRGWWVFLKRKESARRPRRKTALSPWGAEGRLGSRRRVRSESGGEGRSGITWAVERYDQHAEEALKGIWPGILLLRESRTLSWVVASCVLGLTALAPGKHLEVDGYHHSAKTVGTLTHLSSWRARLHLWVLFN